MSDAETEIREHLLSLGIGDPDVAERAVQLHRDLLASDVPYPVNLDDFFDAVEKREDT